MTSKEYELFTKFDFERRLKVYFGKPITLKHLEKLKSPDGTVHEVDLNYDFEIDRIVYQTIIECKHWNQSVTREQVKSFKSVRDDLRAHKAIIVTNHGFQSGAIEFAKKHGIGLIKLTKRQRKVFAHMDGGLSTIEQEFTALPERELTIGEDLTMLGLFYPNDEALGRYLVQKFGKELALFLFEMDDNKDFDLDNPNSPISDNIIKAIKSVPDEWYKDYELIETSGLHFKLENEPMLRLFNMKIFLLKTFVATREANS